MKPREVLDIQKPLESERVEDTFYFVKFENQNDVLTLIFSESTGRWHCDL